MKNLLLGLLFGFLSYPLLFTPLMIKYAPEQTFFKWLEWHLWYLQQVWGI
jgi:hypothetical protein